LKNVDEIVGIFVFAAPFECECLEYHECTSLAHPDIATRPFTTQGLPVKSDKAAVLKGKLQAWRNDGCKAFFKISECTATVALQSGGDQEIDGYYFRLCDSIRQR
jgi:hypothetical protein